MVAGVVRTCSERRRLVTDLGRPHTTLGWVELAELIRAGETTVLHALALLRGVHPDIQATTSVTLGAAETAEILSACESIMQWADVLGTLAATVEPEEVEVCRRDLHREASASLAAGVADVHRVRLLARCLSIGEGFHALAETLRCTSCHESWHDATVGDVLRSFQGSDGHVARRITEEALLSPESRWETCDRTQVARLATALERFVTRPPCP